MSRALLISQDQGFITTSLEVLRALGHEAQVLPVLERAEQGQGFDCWIVDNAPGCEAGRRAVGTRGAMVGSRPGLLWSGAGVSTGLGLAFHECPDGIVAAPMTMASLGSALSRLDRLETLRPTFSLDQVEGGMEAFPPLRVLWAAWRASVRGRVELFHAGDELELFLRDGQVIEGRGLTGRLDEMGIHARADQSFSDLVGGALAAGISADQALDGLSLAIGRALVDTVGAMGGMTLFEPDAQPETAGFPLPRPLPWIIASAMRQRRPVARVRELLEPVLDDHLVATSESMDGAQLPPAALRLGKASLKEPRLAEAIGADDSAWLAADLLLQLGLVRLKLPERRVLPLEPSRPAPVFPPPERSELMAKLLADRARLRELDAAGILGITSSADLDPGALDRRLHALRASYHPDRFVRQPADVLLVARDLFSLVSNAYAELKHPQALDDLRQRLLAKEEGRVWSSESDKRRALMLMVEAEAAYRRKQYALALEAANRAHQLVPDDWKSRFLRARLRRLTGELDASGLIQELKPIAVPEGRARAELLFLMGEANIELGRQDAAYKCFEEAAREFPDHVGARRMLRLRVMRTDGVETVRQRDAKERQERQAERAPPPKGRSTKG